MTFRRVRADFWRSRQDGRPDRAGAMPMPDRIGNPEGKKSGSFELRIFRDRPTDSFPGFRSSYHGNIREGQVAPETGDGACKNPDQ